jgi:hypothetical protein
MVTNILNYVGMIDVKLLVWPELACRLNRVYTA